MDFVALDFETANSSRSSVCSIGLVSYENGQIVDEYYRLVKPKRNYFSSINVSIHGITREDVQNEETFDTVWQEDLRKRMEGKFVLAHNAQFDMGVLRAVLDEYQLQYPMLAYNCTVNIAKKIWPLPRHNLSTLTNYLNIPLNHHHALADARACGQIFLYAAERLQAETAKEVVERSRTTNGLIYERGYEPAKINKKKRAVLPDSFEYMAAMSETDQGHLFYGKSLAFTGSFQAISEKEAMELAARHGGKVEYDLPAETSYLIVGNLDYEAYHNGEKTVELERAEILMGHGHPIEIMSESEFLRHVKKG